MKNYKKFLELKKQVKKYADGGDVRKSMAERQKSPAQVIDKDTGKVKKSVDKPPKREDDQELSQDSQEIPKSPSEGYEDLIPQEEKRKQDVSDYIKYLHSFSGGGQVQEPQQKQYQAKDYFGKGSNGAGEGVANSQGVMMSDGGDLDKEIAEHKKTIQLLSDLPSTSDEEHEQRRHDLINSYQEALKDAYDRKAKTNYDDGGKVKDDDNALTKLGKAFKEAFAAPTPTPTPEETQEEKYEKIRQKNRENFGYADGGMVSTDAAANTASSLSPLLKQTYAGPDKKKKPVKMATGGWSPEQIMKEPKPLHMPGVHSPAEKKYPINIPRAPKITIPKRLRPVGDIRGYDEGGDVDTSDLAASKDVVNAIRTSTGGQSLDNAKPDSTPNPKYTPSEEQKRKAIRASYGYADGGDVQDPVTGNIDPNSPEGLALIQRGDYSPAPSQEQYQNNLEALKKKYKIVEPVQGDEQHIDVDQGPYPGEDEDANKAADMTTDAQIGLLDRIKDAGKDEESPEEDKSEGRTTADEDIDKAAEKEFGDKEDEKPEEDLSEDEKALAESPDKAKEETPKTELQQAQERRNQAQMWNQIGAAAERGAAGYAGIKPTQQETYKENMQIAQQAVDDVKDRMKYQGEDPNSNLSKTYRQYLEKFSGQPVSPQTSASDIQGVMPLVFKDFEAKEAQKTRAAIASERASERLQQTQMIVEQRRQQAKEHNDLMKTLGDQKAEASKGAKADKQEKSDLDRVDKMNKMITEDIATSRSAFGVAARNKQSVENIKALLDGTKDFNDLDNRQVVETARVLDRVLSGGQATISGSEHLTPESARQWVAKKLEFITSKRQGAGAGSFVKTMADTLEREGHTADKQIKASQSKMMGPYKSLEKNDPDSRSYQNYIATLKSHGLDALLPDSEKEQPQATAQQAAPTSPGQPGKKVVKKGYNAKTNQTQLIYDDGTKEIVDGRQ